MADESAEANADIAAMSFEDALAELEAIVRGLDEGNGDLEGAIGAYERGAALKRHKLKEAKAMVDKISIGPDGAAELESMELD